MSNDERLDRRKSILEIIDNEEVETQNELMIELKNRGFKVTQATISRDLKELNIIRVPVGKLKYKYILANKSITMDRMVQIFKDAVQNIELNDNMICVKTLPGMAQGVAEMIDNIDNKTIVGTLGGNNNILILCKNIESAKKIEIILNNTLRKE